MVGAGTGAEQQELSARIGSFLTRQDWSPLLLWLKLAMGEASFFLSLFSNHIKPRLVGKGHWRVTSLIPRLLTFYWSYHSVDRRKELRGFGWFVTSVLGPNGSQINSFTSVLWMDIPLTAILVAPLNNLIFSYDVFLNLQIRLVENLYDKISRCLIEEFPSAGGPQCGTWYFTVQCPSGWPLLRTHGFSCPYTYRETHSQAKRTCTSCGDPGGLSYAAAF